MASSSIADRLRALSPEKQRLLALKMRASASNADRIVAFPRNEQEPLPLSFSQQRLWLLHQWHPESPLYNTFLAVRLTGRLRTDSLIHAFQEIIRRHQALRTTFSMDSSGPVQIIHPPSPFSIPVVDLRQLPAEHREKHALLLARQEVRRPFNLATGPVLRALLLTLGENEQLLVLTMHHIVSDRWSVHVLVHELSVLYDTFCRAAASPLPELMAQYADFALWQRSRMSGDRLKEQLDYWKEQLAAPLPRLDFYSGTKAPATHGPGANRVSAQISSHLIQELTALGQQQHATLFMTMLAAFRVLLYRYTRQEDAIVGTPITNRETVETQALIGFFLNTLALRNRLIPSQSFLHLLQDVRNTCLESYAHQELPFERLVEELQPERKLDPNPIFQVMFTLNDAHDPMGGGGLLDRKLQAHDIQLTPLELDNGSAAADLVLHVENRGAGSNCTLEYNEELFSRSAAQRMLGSLLTLLERIAKSPESAIHRLIALSEQEQEVVLGQWNHTSAPYPGSSGVHELFLEQAGNSPDAPAAVFGGSVMTYNELNESANRLARFLKEKGVGVETNVGLCMERSPELIVAMLATLKAGAAYVPLDAKYPAARLAYIAEDAGLSLALTHSRHARLLENCGRPVLCLDQERENIDGQSGENLQTVVSPDSLAYVIYTSGTTGRPKGVAIPHRGIARLVRGTDYLQLSREDRVAHVSTPSFDAATFEIWGALLNGARLVSFPEEIILSPALLQSAMREQGITAIFMTTALFNRIARDNSSAFQSVGTVLFGGEACDPAAIRSVLESAPPKRLLHVYGPTENTTFSTWHLVEKVDERAHTVPIGRPLANSTAYILDPLLQPVPAGVVGELFLAGEGLGRGYFNDPWLTAERFLPHPFSNVAGARMYRTGDLARHDDEGNIEFAGRVDQQIKLRGFRIELGEIEDVLRTRLGVREAIVTLREDRPGHKYLAAYMETDDPPSAKDARLALKDYLPDYMVPSVFVSLPSLPVNVNGKIDRHALPQPPTQEQEEEDFVLPATPTEAAIAAIWAELLGQEKISATANFFELGGHSLLAIQTVKKVRDTLNVDVPMRSFFQNSTVAELAREVEKLARSAAGLPEATFEATVVPAPEQRFDPFPLTEVQQAYWLGRSGDFELGDVSSHGYFELEIGGLDLLRFEHALRLLIARHDALRMLIHANGEQQVLESVPPYRIETQDLRGLAPEAASAKALEIRARMSHQVLPSDRWPLFEFRASLMENNRVRLHISIDALMGDAWSWRVLANDLASLYNDPETALPPLELTFRDYVLAEAALKDSGPYKKSAEYWHSRLDDFPSAPAFPLSPRKGQTSRFVRRAGALAPEAWQILKGKASARNLTPSALLLGIFSEVLAVWNSSSRFTLTLTLFNRLPLHPEVNQIAGDFTSLVLLAIDHQVEKAFTGRAQNIQTQLWKDLDHRYMSGIAVIRELTRRNGGNRVSFPVVFTSLLGLDMSAASSNPFHAEVVYGISQTPQVWLDCQVYEKGGGLSFSWDSVEDIFPAGFLDSMFEAFQGLLRRLGEDDRLWESSRLSLLPAADLAVLAKANATEGPAPEALLHHLFESQAQRQPAAVAVISHSRSLAYSELDWITHRLALQLRHMETRPGELVAVVMEKGWEQVAAVLGIVRAGAAYLPIDPGVPTERLLYLLENGDVRTALTQSWVNERTSWPSRLRRIAVDEIESGPEFPELPGLSQSHDDLAYVIYTSGSTGNPKGVMIRHQGAVNTVLDINERFQVGPRDRVLALSSLNFDLSVYDIFGALAAGAAIVIPRDAAARDPRHWHELLASQGVTIWNSVPALMSIMTEHLAAQDLKFPASLRLAMLSGDWIPVPLPDQIRRRGEDIDVVSLGGATEASIWSILYPVQEVDAEWRSIPYGIPMRNQTFHVLDAAMEPRPVGVPGELYIGGMGLADGYWKSPELSHAKFIQHPVSGARIYRTGDFGRYLPDGNIEFLGRQDLQVKIQGYRIELGEIEAAILRHANVRECAVGVTEGVSGGKQLVAFLVAREQPAPSQQEMKAFLKERLPGYMSPVAFIACEGLPLTANGKVDRKALAAFKNALNESREATATIATPTQELLASLWREILGVDEIQPHDDFFLLGGHSMLVTRMVSQLREIMQVELPLRAVFEASTLSELAHKIDCMRAQAEGQAPPITPAERGEMVPVSFAQQRLWFIDQLTPGNPAYNMPLALRLSGKLNVAALERSLQEIEKRHETVRTIFRAVDGKPFQVILPPERPSLPLADLRAVPAEFQREECARLAEAEARTTFDLSTGPMMRALLMQTGDDDFLLCVTMHHILCDAWSMGVLLREMTTLYQGFDAGEPAALPDLPVQYADFSLWQHAYLAGEVFDQQLNYWRKNLAGAPPVLELPLDKPRPLVQRFAGAHCPLRLDTDLTASLKALSAERHVTLFMTVLAGFQLLLARLSGQEDIVVGSPVANRNHREIEGLIGFFANTLVFRTQLRDNPTFEQLLGRVRETALAAYAHQDVPFERIVEELQPQRALSHTPIFQVMFVFQNTPFETVHLPNVRLQPVDIKTGASHFDLTLRLWEDAGSLTGRLEYNSDIFENASIARMAKRLEKLLASLVKDPSQHAHSLDILMEDEKSFLAQQRQLSARDYPAAPVHQLFEAHARQNPDSVAVICGDCKLSYRELNERAERIAGYLRAHGVTSDAPVAICMERSVELAATLLAILKSGGHWLPLDPEYPEQRREYMLRDAQASLLVGNESIPKFSQFEGNGHVWQARVPHPEDVAYVIYTSGSTGMPKGVMVPHSSLSNYVHAMHEALELRKEDVYLHTASFSFSSSVRQLFVPLTRGAAVVIAGREQIADPALLFELAKQTQVTVMDLVPSYWRNCISWLESLEGHSREQALPQSLRLIACASEPLRWELPDAWRAMFGKRVALMNMLGQTETAGIIALQAIPAEHDRSGSLVPVGRPIANTGISLMDPYLNPVPPGVVADIYIAGRNLARGYLGRPELTAESFVPDPFSTEAGGRLYRTGDLGRYRADGTLEFLGRKDTMVKIRGFRVELGEVEATLNQQSPVKEAAVISGADAFGYADLTAYVVWKDNAERSTQALREALHKRLPDYMVPGHFVVMERLPRTASGKLDRKALPESDHPAADPEPMTPPRTPLEQSLAEIFAEVLKTEMVGVHTSFFNMGGHSLLATQVMSRIQTRFQIDLPLRVLFEAPTIAELTEYVEVAQWMEQMDNSQE